MSKCQRCGTDCREFTFSFFNVQMICGDCRVEEQAHSSYAYAKKIEWENVRQGNLNFRGIGLPEDLSKKYQETSIR